MKNETKSPEEVAEELFLLRVVDAVTDINLSGLNPAKPLVVYDDNRAALVRVHAEHNGLNFRIDIESLHNISKSDPPGISETVYVPLMTTMKRDRESHKPGIVCPTGVFYNPHNYYATQEGAFRMSW